MIAVVNFVRLLNELFQCLQDKRANIKNLNELFQFLLIKTMFYYGRMPLIFLIAFFAK